MNHQTQQPAKLDFGGLHQTGGRESYQSTASLPRPGRAVNHSLLAQAAAAEQKALADAAWHRERATSYLRWVDLPWAAGRYVEHVEAAEFQERLAARHAAVLAALGQVRP